ncbi:MULTISPECIES: hypothetical protein [Curtobacterium]|jgi:hypothetical protein|uniref:hypothetical protein n=1 Tax=Curtobacterium TaxID=2034 RepID=UPI0011A26C83|nr:hypothetical protein [Curtobacterium pusillum]
MGGTTADWIGAASSGAAVIVSVLVALFVGRQSASIAANQVRQEREAYLAGRMQGLVDHARAVVTEARTVWALTSTRFRDELLQIPAEDEQRRASRQEKLSEALTRLETEVGLLRAYGVTMPNGPENAPDPDARAAVSRLTDEGTWLSSAAQFAAYTHFEDPDDSSDDSVFDDLVSGHLENIDARLLASLPDGMDPDRVPYYREPGSPWPAILDDRRDIMRDESRSWAGEPLPVVANRAVAFLLNRFQDELITVLDAWNKQALRRD